MEQQRKTVRVGDQECTVETMREWLNWRIAIIRMQVREEKNLNPKCSCRMCLATESNLLGRVTELLIIREKLNDGRIQEIG